MGGNIRTGPDGRPDGFLVRGIGPDNSSYEDYIIITGADGSGADAEIAESGIEICGMAKKADVTQPRYGRSHICKFPPRVGFSITRADNDR